MSYSKTLGCFAAICATSFVQAGNAVPPINRPIEHIEDTTFSTKTLADDSNQSFPLGNGDLGVNIWAEKNGDLLFYISKSDAWGENMETLKIGKVRIHIDSMPFVPGHVTQTLFAHEGRYQISAKKCTGSELKIEAWVDANNPQILLKIDSDEEEVITISNEAMRGKEEVLATAESPWAASKANLAFAMQTKETETVTIHADDIIETTDDSIAWAHYNRESLWLQNIEMSWLKSGKDKLFDPLTHYAFGAHIAAPNFTKTSSTKLKTETAQKSSTVCITVLRSKVETLAQWSGEIAQLTKEDRGTYQDRLQNHRLWWNEKFNHSYVSIRGSKEARRVSQNYNLQRYVSLSAGRGNYPIRFNGSIFTYDHRQTAPLGGQEDFGADYRRWGSLLFVQNTRLNYWPMLVSGDLDTIEPLIDYIKRIQPALALNALNYGVDEKHNALATFEAMTLWGTLCTAQLDQASSFDELYKKSWALQYHGSALELLLLCFDRYSFSQDETFLHEFLLPFADGTLAFYDHFFEKRNGKIRIEGNSLETYNQTVNPTPDLAGLRKNLEALLCLPQVTGERRAVYTRLLSETPEIPLKNGPIDYGFLDSTIIKYGHWVDFSRPVFVSEANQKIIDVAHEVPKPAWNQENPELYAIFPYRNFHVGVKESNPELYDIAKRTYLDRVFQQDMGWAQDPIQAAWLGLAEEAKQRVIRRFNAKLPDVLFPVFWKPSYDWSPDQDNGGVAINALQSMLLIYDKDQIYLCPAWPKGWDVKFKLYGPKETTVVGEIKNDKLHYEVTPKSRESAVHSLF